jgi:aldehyde dehydrogenase (NAD+)
LRRLFLHRDLYDRLVPRLRAIFAQVTVGNPLDADTLVGPLIDQAAFDAMQAALEQARAEGGQVAGGERLHAAAVPRRILRPSGNRRNARPDADHHARDLRADPLRYAL